MKIANPHPQSAVLSNIIAFPKQPCRKARSSCKLTPQSLLRDIAGTSNIHPLFPDDLQVADRPQVSELVADACLILSKRSGALGFSAASGDGFFRPSRISLMMRL